jgi:hypothetical protein
MGNVRSFSSQAVLGGIVLLSGVAYYLYGYQTPTIHVAKPSDSVSPKPNKKGKKKKSKQSTPLQANSSSKDQGAVAPIVVAFPTVLPGQFDAESIASDEPPASQSKKSRKKGKVRINKRQPALRSQNRLRQSHSQNPNKSVHPNL